MMKSKPNLVYVFSDQHRAEATGYAGNPDVKTSTIDRMQQQSISFNHAVANAPVCGPARASLLTGQRGLTNGMFVNDVPLSPNAVTIGKVFKTAGYNTAYIGKWHVDGHGRLDYIPPERRQGFDFWRVMECTHNYNRSYYYADEPEKRQWTGYDAEDQTRCVCEYIRNRDKEKPFALFLSWGPPHSPYMTAPERFREMYRPEALQLRPNVPESCESTVRPMLAGYYAHITALDDCLNTLWDTLRQEGIEEDTIFIYTSDHGDMLGAHGQLNKQRPWDESIRVPFLLHYPAICGTNARVIDTPISTIDIMPTLLDLCGMEIPEGVEGVSLAPLIRGEETQIDDAVMIECVHPFGQWIKQDGAKEYRGIRTSRFTYVRDLQGPWLLYDNQDDPCQMQNLIGTAKGMELLPALELKLQKLLDRYKDEFLPGEQYISRWGYSIDETGTVPYTGWDPEGA